MRLSVRFVEEEEGGRIHLIVSGTGIRKEVMHGDEIEQLFEPYHAVASTSSDPAGSLGLRIWPTCRKIAEYTRGSIQCVFNA